MIKTILKEGGIIILLLLAISLILAILFYDYIPSNKTVPIRLQAYNMPSEIEEELGNGSFEEQNIVRTFYIDSSDLDVYESTNDYDKGKANPFADYSKSSDTSSSTKNENSTNTTKTNTTNTNSSNTKDTRKSNNSDSTTEENKTEEYMTTPGKN